MASFTTGDFAMPNNRGRRTSYFWVKDPTGDVPVDPYYNYLPISEKEVSILGFDAAGWQSLTDFYMNKEHIEKVYEFGKSPLSSTEESIYLKHHGQEKVESRTEEKKEAIRLKLSTDIKAGLDRLDDTVKDMILQELHDMFGGEEVMTCEELTKKKLTLAEHLNNILGNHLIPFLSYALKNIEDTREKDDNQFSDFNLLKGWVNQANNDLSGLQKTLYGSKAILADTLQENIRRFHKGENMIPIHMVILKRQSNDGEVFMPNLESSGQKLDIGITSAELRFAQKMCQEIPDEEIRLIMTTTFHLKEMVVDSKGRTSFLDIENPWDAIPEVGGNWSRDKSPDKPFAEKPWVKDLIKFNQQCKDNLWSTVSRRPQKKALKQKGNIKKALYVATTLKSYVLVQM